MFSAQQQSSVNCAKLLIVVWKTPITFRATLHERNMLLMIELATSTSIELPRETSLALARFGEFLFELFVVGIKLQCSLIGSSRTGLLIRF